MIILCNMDTCIWGVGGKIEKLWKGTTGRKGITMVICLPLIALPMMVKYFKINIRYEVRKGLHYLFFAFAVAFLVVQLELPVASFSPTGSLCGW